MVLSKIKLAGIIVLFFISGCTEKDELTHPVRIHFGIGMTKQNEYANIDFPYDVNYIHDYFVFAGGEIGIEMIQFEGRREAGGDVIFETGPKMSFPVIIFGKEPGFISVFDIPQGIYNYMKWDIHLKKIVTEYLTDDIGIDSLNTGLIIKGTFVREYWIYTEDLLYGYDWHYVSVFKKPFIFAIDDTQQFSTKAYPLDPYRRIVLTENTDYVATLKLDLPYAFNSISGESFEKAEISGDSEHPVVIISRNKNKYLYETILHRLELSSSVYIY